MNAILAEEFKSFSFLFVPNPEDHNGFSLDGNKDAKLLKCLCKSDILSHNSITELWHYRLFNAVYPLGSYQNVLQSALTSNKIEKGRTSNFPPVVHWTTILRNLHKAAKKSKPWITCAGKWSNIEIPWKRLKAPNLWWTRVFRRASSFVSHLNSTNNFKEKGKHSSHECRT